MAPALLGGRDDAVADRRQRSVPEALPRILLQTRAGTCLAFSFDWYSSNSAMICRIMTLHRIVAHLLRDGDELDAILGELPDVELKLEVIAKDLVLLELLRSRPAGYSPAGIWLGASM